MMVQPRCRQAVILVGGKGTRLGALTAETPKPLLAIAPGKVFLDLMIDELGRQGFDDIILLAGYLGEQFVAHYKASPHVRVVIEDAPRGTGGAIHGARAMLADRFLLMNGDSFFDFNFRSLEGALRHTEGAVVAIALKEGVKENRFGNVTLADGRVTAFAEKSAARTDGPAYINAGIYFCDRAILDHMPDEPCSIEYDIFPKLVAARAMAAVPGRGYFIDIGLPETLALARANYDAIIRRPALFLDRDGTINHDDGYTHKVEDLKPIDGALELIRHFCDRGWHVFVFTNQAGIARGYYGFDAVARFHDHLEDVCAEAGGFIHDFEICPFHEAGIVPEFKVSNHPRRKPNPGMILDLMDKWPVDRDKSIVIGDRDIDVLAAEAAGLRGFLFDSGNLMQFARAQGLIKDEPRHVSD